jgi:hypothetical protein
MQGEVVAYLLREALVALLKLGGEKPFDLKQSAQRVVTASKLPERTADRRAIWSASSANLSEPWETPTRRASLRHGRYRENMPIDRSPNRRFQVRVLAAPSDFHCSESCTPPQCELAAALRRIRPKLRRGQ